jgi:hypothetical protein
MADVLPSPIENKMANALLSTLAALVEKMVFSMQALLKSKGIC